MTEPSATKKKPYPVGAIFWGAVGLAAAFRALYRPNRTVVKDGFPTRCAGVGCDPGMVIDSYSGQNAVFSPLRGHVAASTPSSIWIVLADEATVLEFTGAPNEFLVQVQGGKVTAGQQIGLASRVRFAVYALGRTPQGGAVLGAPIEPASWLAAHGAHVSAKYHKTTAEQWCAGGRKLVVPQAVANCKIKLPAPSGFALLPVSATME